MTTLKPTLPNAWPGLTPPATREDDGDSLTGRLVECPNCGEIELPFEGGECRGCHIPVFF